MSAEFQENLLEVFHGIRGSDEEEALFAASNLGGALVEQDIPIETVSELYHEALKEFQHNYDGEDELPVELFAPVLTEMLLAYGLSYSSQKATSQQIKKALDQRERQFRSTFETAGHGMALVGTDQQFVKVNKVLCNLLGYSETELLDINLKTITHVDDVANNNTKMQQLMDGQSYSYQMNLRYVCKNKSYVWVQLNVALARDADNIPLYFIWQAQDITEQINNAAELDSHANALKLTRDVALFANQSDSFANALKNCLKIICEYMNWPIGHIYLPSSKDPSTLVPTKLWNFEHQSEAFQVFREVTEKTSFQAGVGLPGRVLEAKAPQWIVDVTKDRNFPRAELAKNIGVKAGLAFPVMVGTDVASVFEFFSEDALEPNDIILQTMAQIGSQLELVFERDRAQQELRFRAELLNKINEGIILTDLDRLITSANKGAEAMWEYSEEELIGSHFSTLYVDRDAPESVENIIKILKEENHFERERKFLRKSGEEFHGRLSASLLTDDDGQPEGLIGVIRDITESKTAEEQLVQVQKMEAVGQLTGGIAHDFNNMLTVVTGNLHLIERQKDLDDKLRKRLKRISHAAERGVEMTRRLLTFSRKQVLETTSVDINSLVYKLSDMLKRTMGEHISLKVQLDEGLPNCKTDAGQLENAVLNLCINARDAMPEGGSLTIESKLKEIDTGYLSHDEKVNPGTYVELSISDEGTGMPQKVIDKVFEPFFTTKGAGKGTGLGLSMVYGFMKQSGGHVSIYSEEGFGTTFKLYVPVDNETQTETSEPAEQNSWDVVANDPSLKDITILFVDDDPNVKEVGVDIISEMGLQVHDANDGPSALAILDNLETLDLLITDIVMPGGMRGDQLADSIRERHPDVKVIFLSGYAEKALERMGSLKIGDAFLSKPYKPEELIEKINNILASNTK